MPKADQREAAKKFLYGLSIQMGNNWSWGYNGVATNRLPRITILLASAKWQIINKFNIGE